MDVCADHVMHACVRNPCARNACARNGIIRKQFCARYVNPMRKPVTYTYWYVSILKEIRNNKETIG